MKTTPEFTSIERKAVDAYIAAHAKQTGNLHERMKWALEKHKQLQAHALGRVDSVAISLIDDIAIALLDIQAEVAYITPPNPPYGRRGNAPRAEELR